MVKRKSYAADKVLHAEEHADAKQSAERFASENGLTITEEVTVNYAKVQIPTTVGVLSALIEQNKELHAKAGQLLDSMGEGGITTRTRGERRRHYNQTMERITRNHTLISALLDKQVIPNLNWTNEVPTEPEPQKKAPAKAKPKAKPKAKAKKSKKVTPVPTKTEIREMKVGDLRKLCIIHGLSEEGNGSQLRKRLNDNFHTE